MPNTLIVGTQWGDEGKGKTIDILAEEHDVIVRYQGGGNAGHTVVANGEKYALHVLPSGIIRPGKINVVGNNVLIDPEGVVKEIEGIQKRGIDVNPESLRISHLAPVTTAYHKAVDAAKNKGIGTTQKGIGPTYVDKIDRVGIRVFELFDENKLREKVQGNLKFNNHVLGFYDSPPLTLDDVMEPLLRARAGLKPFVCYDVADIINQHDGSVLGEGAQATMLDIDFGTYPFVTGSNPTLGGFYTGTGAGFIVFDEKRGTAKAYTTRVGNGPFPTELNDDIGKRLRERGHEYGTTTGRPRRCGWLDLLVLRHARNVNGLDALDLTKLDVLDEEEQLPVCIDYKVKGVDHGHIPVEQLENCEPVYENLPGWKTDTSKARKWEDLPRNAQNYIKFIEEFTELPVVTVGVGPGREQTIIR